MMEQLPKTAIALLAGLAIGAGIMYGLITGYQAKQENITLKEQAQDRNRRQAITTDIASSSEKNRRSIHQTMKALHDQTETHIADNDNVILPASAVRLHDDAVLQRLPDATRFPDAGAQTAGNPS